MNKLLLQLYQIANKAKKLREALQKNQQNEAVNLSAEIESLAEQMLKEGKK